MQRDINDDDTFVDISASNLSLQALVQRVEDDGAGAVATFSGNTRNNFQGKEVTKLEYEAYQPMARKKLQERKVWLLLLHSHPLPSSAGGI